VSIDIRLPNITARDEAGQLAQIRSYLHQMVEQLNWALGSIETSSSEAVVEAKSVAASANSDPVSTFNGIKALIIKSADIITAYSEEISRRLDGLYVAESEFGVYKEETSQVISETSTELTRAFSNIQSITDTVDGISEMLIGVNATIKAGLLYYDDDGIPVYGLEVGQKTEKDGVEVFNAFARFVASRLSFYDENGNEVAYVSNNKLFINQVEVLVSYKISGFVDSVRNDKSVVTKWVEGV
jgi:hypothetical protein